MYKLTKVFIAVIIIFYTAGIVNAQKSGCPKGYISKDSSNKNIQICYNPQTHLSYKDYKNNKNEKTFSLRGIVCGKNCDSDGKNCKVGICDENVFKNNGYTEIKQNRFYNPAEDLSYFGNNFFYNGIWCGYGCKLDGTGCKEGICRIEEIKKLGYTQIKQGKFHNPSTNLSYSGNKFYFNDEFCGYSCKLDGTGCTDGICNPKDCKNGYTELKNNKCYNPKTHLSYEGKYFYINNVWCGINCTSDGKNCEIGICDENEIKKHGYTEIKQKMFYNPKTHISFAGYGFFFDGMWCGKSCDLDGKNCAIGLCNIEYCNKNGFKEIKGGTCHNSDINLSYSDNNFYLDDVWCGFDCNPDGKNCQFGLCDRNEIKKLGFTEIKNGRFYNPKTHLSVSLATYDFYIDDMWCGSNCDFEGKNCKIGICSSDNCKIGYENLDIKQTKYWAHKNNLVHFPCEKTKDEMVCRNDSGTKYYNVSDPQKTRTAFWDKIKHFFGFFGAFFK